MKLSKVLKELYKNQNKVFVRKSEYEAAEGDDLVRTIQLTNPGGTWTQKEFIDAFKESRKDLTKEDWKTTEWMEVPEDENM